MFMYRVVNLTVFFYQNQSINILLHLCWLLSKLLFKETPTSVTRGMQFPKKIRIFSEANSGKNSHKGISVQQLPP